MADFPALNHIQPSASAGDQGQAAHDLIVRVVGADIATHFVVKIIENTDRYGKDTFIVSLPGVLIT